MDSIYQTFLSRVAEGRNMKVADVDSVGQGRVWTGNRAITIGLVDRIGGMSDAMAAAAKLAKLKEYRIREYPEKVNLLERLTGSQKHTVESRLIRRELGEELTKIFEEWKQIKSSIGKVQARMPFNIIFK